MGPKRQTPPAGYPVHPVPEQVLAQTMGPVVWEEATDSNLPVMEQINQRTHKQSVASVAVIERLGSLEKGHAQLATDLKDHRKDLDEARKDIQNVSLIVARGDGKLDTLVEQATYEKLAREEKAKAEALATVAENARVDAEAKRIHELKTMRLSTRVALWTAVLSGIAAIIAAFAWITTR